MFTWLFLKARTYVLPAVVVREFAEGGLRRATCTRAVCRNQKVPFEIDQFAVLNTGKRDVHIDSTHMDNKAFSFNSSAKYRAGGHFKEKQLSLADQEIMVNDKESHFQAAFPDIFADYQNPPLIGDVTVADKAWHAWSSTPFDWWQRQLNFALWCGSAGCDVSFEDHLQGKDPLLASLYTFHLYYTTKRLLEELRDALPGDKSHSWYNNEYDDWGYKRLCSEFGVSPDMDWR